MWPILPLRITGTSTITVGDTWTPWYWTTGACCAGDVVYDQYNRPVCLGWLYHEDALRASGTTVTEEFTESILRLVAESLGEEFVLQTMGSESFEIPDEGIILDSIIGGRQLRAQTFSYGFFTLGTLGPTVTKSVTSYTRVFFQETGLPYVAQSTHSFILCSERTGPHDGIIDTNATTTTSDVLVNDSDSYRLFLISKGLPEEIRVTHLPSGRVKIYELGTDSIPTYQMGSAFYQPRQYP
jgi:hypothetical protein